MCGARSGVRQEKKQSAKGLTCHKCGKAGHIRRNCHKGRSEGSAQSADGDSVRGGRPGARGRGKERGRGSRGRGRRIRNQAAAGGDASAVASSAATLGGAGAAAGLSGSYVASRIVYVGGAGNSVGSAGVDSSQPLGQAGPVSGAPSAGATAATAPSAYSATWSGGNADFLFSTPSAGAQSGKGYRPAALRSTRPFTTMFHVCSVLNNVPLLMGINRLKAYRFLVACSINTTFNFIVYNINRFISN